MAEGFRFMPLDLVRLRTFRLSAWVTYTSEFESHWVPLSYGLVPHLSKKLSKFPVHGLLRCNINAGVRAHAERTCHSEMSQ